MLCPNCQTAVDLVDARFCASCGHTLADDNDPLIGKLVGNRYRVVSLVAEGGMGRVYAAEQEMGGAKRKVAIKVLLSQHSGRKADVARFMRECSMVAELEHPNTIKFYDYGQTEDGDLYIAMEFVRGRSLARELVDRGPLSAERVDLIVGQICGSLQEAHDKGIIHRDLKPDNIILTDAAGQGDFVKVLDFGIAKRMDGTDSKLTPLGVVLGSPPYMSPEQFTLQNVDARSDIYALGVVAYQSLTGQMPFEAQEMLHWATLHMTESPMPFETTDVGMLVPAPMRRAVLRALSKEPAQRPASMRELYAEFTLGERKSFPAGRASVVPHAMSSEVPVPMPPSEPASLVRAQDQVTLHDASLSGAPGAGDSSAPIPLLPRPAPMPTGMGAQPTRAATDIDLDGVDAPRLTVPELVPPTVRDRSLTDPPPVGESRSWLFALGIVLVIALGGGSAWLVFRGMKPEPARSARDATSRPVGVDAPPTPVESAQPPFPDVAPRPSASAATAPLDDASPCQTAMVGALASKCDLARRSLVRCPETSPHRAAAVRAVQALCAPAP